MADDGVDPNTCFIICFNNVEVTGSWINKRRRRTATSSTEIAATSTQNPQITNHNQIFLDMFDTKCSKSDSISYTMLVWLPVCPHVTTQELPNTFS
jgi:hypothetical protein